MLEGFVITLREGLEAFLIVAVTLAYLRRTGRSHLVRAVHWGIAASVLVSGVAGMLFEQAANQALWKGVLAIAAAVLVSSLLVHTWRAANTGLPRREPFHTPQRLHKKDFPAFLNSNASEFSPAVKFETLNVSKDLSHERIVREA
jgi:hypothetical protein